MEDFVWGQVQVHALLAKHSYESFSLEDPDPEPLETEKSLVL